MMTLQQHLSIILRLFVVKEVPSLPCPLPSSKDHLNAWKGHSWYPLGIKMCVILNLKCFSMQNSNIPGN
jgi:hypothetical protein